MVGAASHASHAEERSTGGQPWCAEVERVRRVLDVEGVGRRFDVERARRMLDREHTSNECSVEEETFYVPR